LKLLAVHGGGYLGAYSGRIDHAWGARPDCKADLPHPPSRRNSSRRLLKHSAPITW
jgi:hypothetical protein